MLFNNFKKNEKIKGFSLVEVVFAVAIFALIAVSIYQGLFSITKVISLSREKIIATDLINSEFELIRNLSYVSVGLQNGIPNGILLATSTVTKDGRDFQVTRTIRNIDDPFDGQIGGSPNDLSPADYKMVEISVACLNCKNSINFSAVTQVAPKNLETASTNGALFVRVFDANGNPVPQANISVQNSVLGININDTSDNNGVLQIVDIPPISNGYRINVTKSGFTTDRTYATSTENPNPLKIDATVLLQQLTQISFIIDRVSNINLRTVNNFCSVVPDVPFNMRGTKLIGTAPDNYKWNNNYVTDSSGFKNINNVEWDNYTYTLNPGFYLAGTNPISPISILPNSNQNVDLIIASGSPAFLLVSVKDSATGLPISNATVRLFKGGFERVLITDKGFFRQTDWSGGSGQLNFGDQSRFYSQDGNIAINNPSGQLKLVDSLGNFVPSGELVSSVFDAGAAANWSQIEILPTDQPVLAGSNSVRFQIASSIDNTATTTWNFLGPDGTNSSFYTITNNNINPIHNGHRYIRYKLFLSTDNPSVTPNISDFTISFSSVCIPPGQVLFDGLTNDSYSLEIQASGFVTQLIENFLINSNWQKQDVLLSP